jgi:hypothetical protein
MRIDVDKEEDNSYSHAKNSGEIFLYMAFSL